MLKKLLSYLIPVIVYQKKSRLSRTLEVTWANGELVLDSKNTNYSYGSLQRILRKGLKSIGFQNIVHMESILVLGVAGGSVIKTLTEEIQYKGKITGVEIDPDIITIANDYFKLNEIPNLSIVIDDAFEFVLKTKEKYDLIIIDIFQDTNMPTFLFEKFFIDRSGFLLKMNGYILFNTMILKESGNKRNMEYIQAFETTEFHCRTIPRVEQHNELIVVQKIA
ncbi:spermidine synthase [Flavobacterium sp. GT3R68]|uniref:spermidine synthase n=1 Tax=Flavobacterium sp. GT3R68 TaxID=2594437 RepID=UPI000F897648|nr:spermidine synthase [Flavobacterium sp. GT3R68]RTY86332.1 spermidine synthase [Flavobacterium sp. GSN2]TRW91556.1 spermidine synthase [Flavobacterium sp. GT3R68]